MARTSRRARRASSRCSGHATTETFPWRIVDYVRSAESDPAYTRFKFIVTANHANWPSAATNRVGI